MSFRLVRKSVTLNDLERRNGRYFALFQRIRVATIAGALRKSSRSLAHLLMSSCLFLVTLTFNLDIQTHRPNTSSVVNWRKFVQRFMPSIVEYESQESNAFRHFAHKMVAKPSLPHVGAVPFFEGEELSPQLRQCGLG